MAAAKVVIGFCGLFYFNIVLFNVVLAANFGASKFIPSINLVHLKTYDGDYMTNSELLRTSYVINNRLHASSVLRKTAADNIQLETPESDVKQESGNRTDTLTSNADVYIIEKQLTNVEKITESATIRAIPSATLDVSATSKPVVAPSPGESNFIPLTNIDASRPSPHLYKRSITSPPIKKAFASPEKKLFSKLATESNIQLKTLEYDAKQKSENTSETVTTNSDASTVETHLTNEKNVTSSVLTMTTVSTTTFPDSTTSTTAKVMLSTAASSTVPVPTTSKPIVTPSPDMPPVRPSNITNTTEDHHVYYNSTLYPEEEKALSFWVDFDTLPQHKIVVNQMLSDSHRKAATVSLKFDFPFYGHPLRNITIATGGFIYMGDYMHSWLAATQYIAPLMANFDTSLSNESTVRYFDNGTAFVIEWHEVTLQDEKKGGNFTFQATLLKNGNIIFVYKVIPVSVQEIGDEVHPVKVGLSDAYVIDRVIYFIRRKTIYEYHRIAMKKEEILNNTAIYFTALTTCMNHRDCDSCMASDVGLCVWCESAKRCSDGLDRLRQDWLQSKCDVEKDSVNCSLLPTPDINPYVQPLTDSPFNPYTFFPQTPNHDSRFGPTNGPLPFKPGRTDDNGASTSARVSEESSSVGVGSVVAILLILAVVLGGLVWVGYAYRNPHTSSGQLLIRYRPTQWRFRSGEARYTAASVHM